MWEQVNAALSQSLTRVLTALAGVIPGILAMLISVVLAGVLGWLLAAVLGQVLRWAKFDQNLERLGLDSLAEWSPSRSPTRLVARLVFWVVLLLGVLVGLAALDPSLMPTFAERLIGYIPNVFVAVLLLLGGGILARFLARGVLIGAVNLQLQSARLLSLGVKWLVLVLTLAMVLDHLGIGGSVLKIGFGILFGGIVLAMALAVGLGSKDVVSRTWERQVERADTGEHKVHNP
ncbi:MAG: mechanosensitive ion channel family protein [Gemmatimonadales bacterium]